MKTLAKLTLLVALLALVAGACYFTYRVGYQDGTVDTMQVEGMI